MSRVNISVIVIAVLLLVLNIIQFFHWSRANQAQIEDLTARTQAAEAAAGKYGSDVTCYTVKSSVTPGIIVTEANLQPVTFPSSVVNDQFVTDITMIINKEFKIGVNPGTPLTNNMFMDTKLEDSTRDRDLMFDHYTVGLKVGDYIDIRMTMPYGDDYVVIPHLRVWDINENTIKCYLTEPQWATYQGAFVDYCLNQAYGCTLYADRYVEPGIQQAAVAYYAVPQNIAALVEKNPNILTNEKDEISDLATWRSSIDELLVIFRDDADTVDVDASKFSAARSAYNAAIVSDAQTVRDEQEGNVAEEEEVEEEAFDFGDTTTTEPEPAPEDVEAGGGT